jgi:uncharacterized protein
MTRVIANWIRRHPLGAFFAWFFTVGWAISFIPAVVETGVRPQLFVLASTLVGLLLPALVITRVVDGPDGLRDLARQMLKVKAPVRWYAFALLAVPVSATLLAVFVFGAPDASPSVLLEAAVGTFLVQTVVGLLTNNLWEETAWMGLVQSRLQARHGAVLAAVATAPLFVLQHLSLLLGSGAGLILILPLLTAMVIPFRALLAWIYNRTGSLFLVGLLHAAGNAAATGAGFGEGALQRVYVQPDADELHLYAEVVLGVLVIAFTWGRLGLARQAHRGARQAAQARP